MTVTVLFSDDSVVIYEDIRKVSNASRNIPNDFLYLYRLNDIPGHPSIRLPMSTVITFEVLLNGFVQ